MNRQRNVSVADRLLFGFTLMVVILGAALVYTQYLFNKSTSVQQNFEAEVFPRLQDAQQLERSVLYLGIGVRSYLLLGGDSRLADYRQRVSSINDRIARTRSLNVANDTLVAAMETEIGRYLAVADSIVSNTREFNGAVELVLRETRESALRPVRAYGAVQQADAEQSMLELAQEREKVSRGLIAAVVAGVLLAVIIGVVTFRSLQKPTAALVKVANSLERQDWAPALQLARLPGPDRPRNEFVRIANAFGAAATSIAERDRRLRSTNIICAATAASLDASEIAQAVLDETCNFVGTGKGTVLYRDGSSEVLSVAAHCSPDGVAPRLPATAVEQVLGTGKSVHLSSLAPDARVVPADEAGCIVVPCCVRDEVVGAIAVETSAANHDFVEASAVQLAVGLDNARTYAQVQKLLETVTWQREQIEEQFEQLQSQHEELQSQHDEMQVQAEELQAQSEELQAQSEEIQAQNEELQAQSAALIEADEQKNRFLGLLAHELRNPMAAISNSMFLLAHVEKDPSLALKARDIIERQTKQLRRLVDDLLDVTRIAHGKLHIDRSEVDLAPIVANVVSDQRTAANAAGVSLECILPGHPLVVHGDGARLQQVLGNLIDNGIKFSRRGGSVVVRVKVAPDKREVVIDVVDDGIGIDPSVHPQLFKPFMQVDPTHTRARGGLGLGLSLVRAYVALHGGAVDMHSDGIGKGCTFSVTLPLLQSKANSTGNGSHGADSNRRAIRPRRVLVVEDNTDGATSLRDALLLDGHSVWVASNVEAALALARDVEPEVTLCDVGLPDIDGYEFARRARTDPTLRAMRIVALTGYATPEDKQRAADAGFDGHLTKPAGMEAIRSIIEERTALT